MDLQTLMSNQKKIANLAMDEFFYNIASLKPRSLVDVKPYLLPSPPPTPANEETSAIDKETKESMEQFQFNIGYEFKNLSLLQEALTHSPHPGRLAYLGDAVLHLALTNFGFLTNPSAGPGTLSTLRAANVSTEKLARVAIRHDFYRYLKRTSPALDFVVTEFTEAVGEEGEEDYTEICFGGSMVKAPKVLADIVESVAAAVYIDCNFNLVEFWKVFRGILEPIIVETPTQQPVAQIHELCQKHGLSIEIKNWKNEKINITNVYVDGELLGVGSSEQQSIAKLNAARDALRKLCHHEVDHMEVTKCSSQISRACEDMEISKQRNVGMVMNEALPNGGEEVDGSKKRLNVQ